MNQPSLFSAGWVRVKQYTLPVMAAGLMYEGLLQIIGELKYPITRLIMQFANAIFLRAVRDRMPLPSEYGGAPWHYYARIIAEAVIVTVVGMFLGLWANARQQRRAAQ